MGLSGTSLKHDNAGMVYETILATVEERHWQCRCIWVYDYPSKKMRLKYRNAMCMAKVWHRNFEENQLS